MSTGCETIEKYLKTSYIQNLENNNAQYVQVF